MFDATDEATEHLKEQTGRQVRVRSAGQLTVGTAEGHQLQPIRTIDRRQYGRIGPPEASGNCICGHTSKHHDSAPAHHRLHI